MTENLENFEDRNWAKCEACVMFQSSFSLRPLPLSCFYSDLFLLCSVEIHIELLDVYNTSHQYVRI